MTKKFLETSQRWKHKSWIQRNSMQRKNYKHIRRPGISSRVDLKIQPKLNCSKPSLENNKTQTTQTQSKTRWSVEFHSFFAPSSVAWATGASHPPVPPPNLAPVRPLAHFVATSAQERCRHSFQERNPAKQEPSHHHQDAPKNAIPKSTFWSENVQNTVSSGQFFLKFWCRKISQVLS